MILLFDSSGMTVKTVLVNGSDIKQYDWPAGRALAKDLLQYFNNLLRQNNCEFKDLSGIGVYRGPGSYTGLRIGLTVLNTLAEAYNIPIVGTIGETWQDKALQALADGRNDKIVLPEYGSEARITQPRK